VQHSLFASVQWTVSTLTRYIRDLLESDITLQDVWVEGEISNLSRPASGHIYFTLKDAGASLRCVMWKSGAARLNLSLQEGMAVSVHGKLGIYEVSGQYQLYADQIRPVGEGALYQEFLRLKAMLEGEGLFDPSRKRPVPELPGRIGIVTSATGAALRDMLNTLRRRLPLVEVVLAPSPVQGVEAPPALASALAALNRQKPDVILLARGGGSIEDLWAFNDERVVRAVAASEAPVICGVGHETDFTLCDFAADLRAPTPTAAAELATPVTRNDLIAFIREAQSRLGTLTLDLLNSKRNEHTGLVAQLRYVSPHRRIQSGRQRVDEFTRRSLSGLVHRVELEMAQVEGLTQRLEALSPLAVLGRGYALVTRRDDGRVVSRLKLAAEEMRVRVSDGEFDVRKSTIVNQQSTIVNRKS
jgi:exodeoxyribonuclease VII large subunit